MRVMLLWLLWLRHVALASAEHLPRWCGPCEEAAAAQQESGVATSLRAHGRRGVVCDLSCLDGDDLSSCNALGLGQACRFCGECEDCAVCPEVAPATGVAATAVSYSSNDNNNSRSTTTSISTNVDDRADIYCSECEAVSTEDAAALALNGEGVVCDPECLTDATLLNCNIFGLGRLCRLCGACNGCEPCPEGHNLGDLFETGAFSEPTTDGPTSSPTGAPTGSPTTTSASSLGQADCPAIGRQSTEKKCRADEEGLSCGYNCVCCEATAVDENCLPVGSSFKDNTCGFTTVYSCDSGVWSASQARQAPCPTATPVDEDTSTPVVTSGNPSSYGEGGVDGDDFGCPVEVPAAADCSQGQEGIECSYGCFCCDEDTEVDENCVPIDPSMEDTCTFTSHLWCMGGVWIRAEAEPHCPPF